MTQKLITDNQLDGISGAKVTGAVANATLAASVTTNANLTGDVTSIGNATTLGTVAVAKGGTGQTTANDALNALLPSQATNNGKVLSTNGTNTSWISAGGGTVTTVSVVTANGVSGSVANATTTPAITLALGAITPSSVASTGTVTGTNLSGTNTGDQTITLTGDVTGTGTGSFATTLATVPATKGGTGQTTITTGDVLYGSATNTISKLAVGTAGQVLTVAGGVPSWTTPAGGAAWGSITGTLSAQTDLATALAGKLNSTNPSAAGTLTVANAFKIQGDMFNLANRLVFQTNAGSSTYVMAQGPSTATTSGGYWSCFGSSDLAASNFLVFGASQSTTLPYAFIFGSTTSATPTYADPTVAFKFVGRGTLTTYGSVNPATGAVSGTDLLRFTDTTTNASKGGTGQISYTTGDILHAGSSTTLTKLAIGTSNQVLKVSGGVPVWADQSAPQATLSTLPSASVSGKLLYVSDANGGAGTICFSNGTNWIDIKTGVTVA
jgi:hypothetical protein